MSVTKSEKFLYSLEKGKAKYFAGAKNNGHYFLSRSQKLLDILGRPDAQIPHLLHIAGTSGKGSVCSYLSAIFSAAHYKTGQTISPHLTNLNERWQINGRPMTARELDGLIAQIKPAIAKYKKLYPGECPSYFEVTAALAFMYFATKKVDWAIIEVGMGGKYDATNAMSKKDAAIITDIGFDHTATLGNTIPKITTQKAGIITSAPVFTSTQNPLALKVIKKTAHHNKANFIPVSTTPKHLKILKISAQGTQFIFHKKNYFIQASGQHQARNAALAITIAEYFKISHLAITKGLKKAHQPARLELVTQKPDIFLDGAHNEQKMAATVSTFSDYLKPKTGNTHLLVGFLADKNCAQMVKQLAKLHPTSIACTEPTNTGFRKTLPPADLANLFKKHCPTAKINTFRRPHQALAWAKSQTNHQDSLLITGSLYLAGEIRPKLVQD